MGALLGQVKGITSVANDTVDKVTTLATLAACLPSILKTALTSPKSLIANAANFAKGLVAQQLNVIKDIVKTELTSVINAVTGKLIGVLKAVQSLVADLKGAIDEINELKNSLQQRAKDIIDFAKNKRNCDALAANLAKCVASKVGGALTKKLQRDFYNKSPLTKITDKLVAKISSVKTNPFEGYVDKYSKQLSKAGTQMSKINNITTKAVTVDF